jgi:hypothetical protein
MSMPSPDSPAIEQWNQQMCFYFTSETFKLKRRKMPRTAYYLELTVRHQPAAAVLFPNPCGEWYAATVALQRADHAPESPCRIQSFGNVV